MALSAKRTMVLAFPNLERLTASFKLVCLLVLYIPLMLVSLLLVSLVIGSEDEPDL